MNKKKLISIIMPTFNCGQYIADSIQSVIAQSIKDWELIIVDDGSTDNTSEVVKTFLDHHPNIYYCKLEKNKGPAFARNEAIKKACGKYVAFLDSDDLWMPDKLEKQITFMQQTKALFTATAYACIDKNGNDLHTCYFPPSKTDYKKCMLLSDPIGNLTVMYDQETLGKFVVPMIKKRNDFALWLQILKKTKYCYGMEEILAFYRKGSINSISRNKIGLMKYHWQLYHNIEKHGFLRSVFEIICWVVVKGLGVGIRKVKYEREL